MPKAQEKERDADGVAIERVQKDDRLRGLNGQEAIYVPGTAPANFGLHGGAKLVSGWFRLCDSDALHARTAAATSDQTRVGFTLAKEKPQYRFLTLIPTALRDEQDFHIPAGDPNWETRTEIVFKQDAQLVWFLPHMNLRGKDMTYRLIYPKGKQRTL